MFSLTCLTCKHFRQHYIRRGRSYMPISDGHCVFPRLKLRKQDTPACPHHKKKRAPDPDAREQ